MALEGVSSPEGAMPPPPPEAVVPPPADAPPTPEPAIAGTHETADAKPEPVPAEAPPGEPEGAAEPVAPKEDSAPTPEGLAGPVPEGPEGREQTGKELIDAINEASDRVALLKSTSRLITMEQGMAYQKAKGLNDPGVSDRQYSEAIRGIIEILRSTGDSEDARRAASLERSVKIRTPDGRTISFSQRQERRSGMDPSAQETYDKDSLWGTRELSSDEVRMDAVNTFLTEETQRVVESRNNAITRGDKKAVDRLNEELARITLAANADGEIGGLLKLRVLEALKARYKDRKNFDDHITFLKGNEQKYMETLKGFLAKKGVDGKKLDQIMKLVNEKGIGEALASGKIPDIPGVEELIFGRNMTEKEVEMLANGFKIEPGLIKKYGKNSLWLILLLMANALMEGQKVAAPRAA